MNELPRMPYPAIQLQTRLASFLAVCVLAAQLAYGCESASKTPDPKFKKDTLSMDAHRKRRTRLRFEALEPRLLLAANLPPIVDAGPDLTLPVSETATLDGTVTDDGLTPSGSGLSTAWVKVRGPGEVTFNDASDVDTLAEFSAPGEFLLRLEANDGQLTTVDYLTINVLAASQAPLVDVGPDQTVLLGADVLLEGTITGGGTNDVMTTWISVSGPSLVTFANPSVEDTSARFIVPGIYELLLQADNGELTGSDRVTITVEAPNTAPLVDAGEDQSTVITEPITLDGVVTDDGLPNLPGTLTTVWSKVSGPGDVDLVDPSIVDATATFSDPGTYVLQLQANDGALTTSDNVTVIVIPAPLVTQSTISQSFNDAMDSFIGASAASTNFGSATTLEVDNGPHYAALLKWDLSDIPNGAVVDSVTLQLDVVNPTNDTYEIYELERAWVEDLVTWVSASDQSQWEIAGAQGTSDRADNVLGTLTASSTGLVTIQLNEAGLATVQSWIDNPAQNHGIIIQDFISAANGVDFSSSEAATAATRPTLAVTYRVDETPASNLPPVVDAGSDQTTVATNAITLRGSVSDDGLPSMPGAVTTTWTKASGPGEVTFGDASAIDSTASFSKPGTYVVRLHGNDGELIASDDLTITVATSGGGNNTTIQVTRAFQDGVSPSNSYTGTRDATLSQSNPTTHYGAATTVEVDTDSDFSGLLRWDVSDVPTSAIVESVTLELNVVNPTSDTFEIYELKKDWVEGQVTWNAASAQSQWETAGAQGASDRGSAVLGTLTALSTGQATIHLNAAGIAVVQSWIQDPAANFGLIVQDYVNASNGVDFNSSEASTASNRPKLNVTYLISDTPGTNRAPMVDVGHDQVAGVAALISLDGTVADDGLPVSSGGLTTTWQKVSGPGVVSFGDAASVDTTVQFSAPGTYVLQLQADDGQLTTSDLLTVSVTLADVPQSLEGFFVSPNASSTGDGSIDNPWDLQTLMAHPSAVKAGDTIWLREGTYRGGFTSTLTGTAAKPITVRAYPGERVSIDTYKPGTNTDPWIRIRGDYTHYQGFEVMSSDPSSRVTNEALSHPDAIQRGGVYNYGDNNKFINLVVHDVNIGFGFYADGVGGEIYGSIIYNNGWVGPDRQHGHGIYTQNEFGVKRIADNIVFNQFGEGIIVYGSSNAHLDGYLIEGNSVFKNGAAAGGGYDHTRNILIGGGAPAKNITLAENVTYDGQKDGRVWFGYQSENNVDLSLKDNYFADNVRFQKPWDSIAANGNRVTGDISGVNVPQGITKVSPSGIEVFVRRNEYEEGRANITVYNWDKAATVEIDLSNALAVGSKFEVHHVYDLFGDPVIQGVYDGNAVKLPMRGVTAPRPIGGETLAAPITLGPEFGAFVVRTVPSAPNAVRAEEGVAFAEPNVVALTHDALSPVVDHAIAQWARTGLSDTKLVALDQIQVQIADLTGMTLAQATSTTIVVDTNATNYGWFVDPTPGMNEEFGEAVGASITARPGSPAAGRMDLLTVVMHELGHVLGHDHEDAAGGKDTLMSETLSAGVREGLDAHALDTLLSDEFWSDDLFS